MNEEFDLSKFEKTIYCEDCIMCEGHRVYDLEDVREFIKRLKEDYKKMWSEDYCHCELEFSKVIDKLAGDGLK